MKLLVVGSGGREHAIAKKLLESTNVEQVFVAPGNDGMRLDGLDLINIGISEHSNLIDFAKVNDIAWTFIGPDDALAAGIVDDFNAAGLKAFGPTKAAAELEWSKDFAKEIGISAVRGGSIVGEHEVIFAGQDEVIEFKHTAYSKAIFGKGAVEAAKYLAGKPAGRYDMSDVIAG